MMLFRIKTLQEVGTREIIENYRYPCIGYYLLLQNSATLERLQPLNDTRNNKPGAKNFASKEVNRLSCLYYDF